MIDLLLRCFIAHWLHSVGENDHVEDVENVGMLWAHRYAMVSTLLVCSALLWVLHPLVVGLSDTRYMSVELSLTLVFAAPSLLVYYLTYSRLQKVVRRSRHQLRELGTTSLGVAYLCLAAMCALGAGVWVGYIIAYL